LREQSHRVIKFYIESFVERRPQRSNQSLGANIMIISFENKVALVTGAASGLGLATAKAFAEAGAAVVLADWNEKEVEAAAKGLADKGHKTMAIPCDVSDDAQVEAMVKQTVSQIRSSGCCIQQCWHSKRSSRNG